MHARFHAYAVLMFIQAPRHRPQGIPSYERTNMMDAMNSCIQPY